MGSGSGVATTMTTMNALSAAWFQALIKLDIARLRGEDNWAQNNINERRTSNIPRIN
jgi:hypothetical protein